MDAVERALRCLELSQTADGSVRREYDGPLFLTPGCVFALHVTGAPQPDGLVDSIYGAQNDDGGWALHFDGRDSLLFTTVLNYVALRLLGVPADDARAARAQAWIEARGGAVAIPSWGKCWLAVLGLYEWEGVNPLPPELWLLPRWFPFHPRRFWCHARVIYLALSYLYGARWRAPETPLTAALRGELYDAYDEIDWRAARNVLLPGDVYTPHSRPLRAANALLGRLEPFVPRRLRMRALSHVLDHVKHEDVTTSFICIGPVNKALNVVVLHAAEPGGKHLRQALDELPRAYLYKGTRGVSMQAYNSSETWDTAFAAQALAASGRVEGHRALAEGAWRFLDGSQSRADVPERRRYHRGPSRGGWPFSTAAHGWPIADCTAEGLSAMLELEAPLGRAFPHDRALAAVDLLLALQNPDGGWPTYERRRCGDWLELLNASELFADIMVDYSYVELTSSAMQALALARPRLAERESAIERALGRGDRYLRRCQRADGSWEGLWGICFTYGTWFGVWGLRAAGAARDDPAILRASEFLCGLQLDDGGWGESYESCLRGEYVPHPEGSQPVMTSWALLALLEADAPGVDAAVDRGVRFLLGSQLPDGDWPQRSVTGVFNKTCMLNYACYRTVFPVWALALHERARQRGLDGGT